jgi:hypothetical protein
MSPEGDDCRSQGLLGVSTMCKYGLGGSFGVEGYTFYMHERINETWWRASSNNCKSNTFMPQWEHPVALLR